MSEIKKEKQNQQNQNLVAWKIIKKTCKYLARLTKKKKKTKILEMRNESGDITANFTEIKRIVREYYEQLYANKLDILYKMTNS